MYLDAFYITYSFNLRILYTLHFTPYTSFGIYNLNQFDAFPHVPNHINYIPISTSRRPNQRPKLKYKSINQSINQSINRYTGDKQQQQH
ncbi:uncharacterized protein EAF01_003675 [Botrytis porri]|uniref:uncharacterized protein n=1 Tax=Botrytis porri TaxID=87229 RepID=UPI0019010963|nr:uncharacterized protein EAF01_003675 [Botrytis porri]KAF7909957.1 hypothetical protein EAF01_003675 [Botrytis porri]